MPNRILREGINSSERIARLQWPEEVLYRRLMSIVDDFGRTEANPVLLRSRCYPLQTDTVRSADIPRWLAACQKAGLILVYDVDGKKYLQLEDFRQQQRSASKYPHPPADASISTASASINATDAHLGVSVSECVSVSTSTDVDAVAVDGEEEKPTEAETFHTFWQMYPKKVCKLPAEKAWQKHGCTDHFEAISAALERDRQSPQWRKEDGQYIPHPATWINQHRWTDEGTQLAERGALVPMRDFIP